MSWGVQFFPIWMHGNVLNQIIMVSAFFIKDAYVFHVALMYLQVMSIS